MLIKKNNNNCSFYINLSSDLHMAKGKLKKYNTKQKWLKNIIYN